jgi:hypothetical protein
MTQDEIIEMLRASCDKDRVDPEQNGFWVIVTEELERFAKLVAKHTLMNIDPSKFIGGYREGFEAGVAKEREACAELCEEIGSKDNTFYREESSSGHCADAIRARGQA